MPSAAFFGQCPERGTQGNRQALRQTHARGRTAIESLNGHSHNEIEIEGEGDDGVLELRDILVIETNDGKQLEFEVVGIVEDDEHHAFAVCFSEKADEFVVTDAHGTLLDDDELAQEILDDFFVLADEANPDTGA